MKLQILEEDIKNSKRGNSKCCPYSRAIVRMYSDIVWDVDVFKTKVKLTGRFGVKWYKLSISSIRALAEFDSRGVMLPHEAKLTLDEGV